MMSLGNNNLVYMMVSKENIPNSQSSSDTQAHGQGQFPTYTVVSSPHTRVSQMMTNVAKPSLVSDIDNPVKSPNKTSIISIVKGSGASNQQIFVRKNTNEMTSDGQNRNLSNDVQLIHPRTPVGETSNHHLFVRKNSSLELSNESQGRNVQPDSQVHHARISSAESFSPNMSMNNQQAPPPYIDASQYSHREIPLSSFQVQSPYEIHRSIHQQGDKKMQKRHDPSRSLHQGEKKIHVMHDPLRSGELPGDHKNQQLHESNRNLLQQEQKNHIYESSRQMYQLSDQKSLQKHETMRSLQQHEANRSMQQHGEGKTQRIRDPSRPLYQLSEQKNQQIHYQLAEQKNQQLHENAQPLYLLSEQKNQPSYESGRSMHQQVVVEPKGQQVHETSRPMYQHNDQKNQQMHDSPRGSHQHNEQKNQQGPHGEQKGQHDPSRSSQHNDPKGQQIHVHKVHHGNARVKYVEFKPIQQGLKYRQMMHHSPRSYNPNLKQTLYYSNHLANSPGNHHLTVQTQGHSPLSPLHSPPALRPPPTIPSGTAWHSPPSLVPSPEVRPRFDFISSPQPITTAGSPCQVQVGNMVPHKMYSAKEAKQMNIPGNHNILLPRLPSNYQLGSPGHQTSHATVVPRSKAAFIQTPSSNSPGNQPVYENNQPNLSQSGIPSSSVATTVTVTMTYIPIPTSTKDKFVYVPVNSGQPVVLYQNQQASGKPVLLPQQVLHAGKNVQGMKDMSKEPTSYTTVRLQGLVNCGTAKGSNFSTVVANSQNSPMKGVKYHLANTSLPQPSNHSLKKPTGFFKLEQKSSSFNIDQYDLEKEKSSLTPTAYKDFLILPEPETKQKEESSSNVDSIKSANQGEVMTLINNQLRLVPPQIGVGSQSVHPGSKRNNIGLPITSCNEFVLQSPIVSTQEKSNNDEPSSSGMNDISLETPIDAKSGKKRGRPPTEKIPKKGRRKDKGKMKLSPMQGNLFSSLSGSPLDSNQVLLEAYKKQQQVQLQKHYFDDPLLKLPDLPPTPESWTADEVHRYILSTDCACYADAIKAEEIDGKSFLLITREALMDFLGVKLGPALKIAGHAAGLRARQRIYCLTLQEQKASLVPKEKKIRIPSKSNLKPGETPNSNSAANVDTTVSSVQNTASTDLIIPTISILPAPPDEKILRPIVEPLPILTDPSPVILKVPNPLPLIMGDGSSSKVSGIEINGEISNEMRTEDKNCVGMLPNTDSIVIDDSKNNTEKIQLDLPNLTANKLDLSQKTLSPSQIYTLTENESNGITHES